MIRPEELRIGNLIQLQGKTCIVNLTTLERLLYPDLPTNIQFKGQYEPIPLTEVWLLKMGFEFNNEKFGYVSKNHMIVISRNDDELIFMPFCTNDEDCYLRISYVHQLQNICFIFGEELKIAE